VSSISLVTRRLLFDILLKVNEMWRATLSAVRAPTRALWPRIFTIDQEWLSKWKKRFDLLVTDLNHERDGVFIVRTLFHSATLLNCVNQPRTRNRDRHPAPPKPPRHKSEDAEAKFLKARSIERTDGDCAGLFLLPLLECAQ
jgi:hypothetical protein